MPVFLMMLFLAIAGPLATTLRPPGPETDLRLVVVAPWQDGARMVEKAGGRLIGPKQIAFARLVHTDNPTAFDRAVRRAGSIWIADGAILARICGAT